MDDFDLLISVIVPVYNAEKYLEKCIDSIINQTYANLEIILVDDGSSDNSGYICDEYALKDKRIQVIHKKNGGVSSARNTALDVCKGDYITFIDADDYVIADYVQIFVDIIEIYNADFIDCKLTDKENELSKENVLDIKLINDRIFTSEKCYFTVTAHCYKRDIIEKNHIRFNSEISYGEDGLFCTSVYIRSDKPYTSNRISYFYNRLNEGATSKPFSLKNLTVLDAYNKCIEITSKRKELNIAFHKIFSSFLLDCIVVFENDKKNKVIDMRMYDQIKVEEFLINNLRKNIFNYINKENETFKMKIIYLLICFLGNKYFKIRAYGR